MSCHPLRSLRGPVLLAWPEPCPDLGRHPQLACLGALHANATAAALALVAAHPDLDVLPGPALGQQRLHHAAHGLLACIETLLVAMERYRAELLCDPSDHQGRAKGVAARPWLAPYRSLEPDQAAFVFDLLQDIANAIWDAGHPEEAEAWQDENLEARGAVVDMPF